MTAWLFIFVGNLQWQLDHLSALAVYPELSFPDLHLLDRFEFHRRMVFNKLLDTLVGEVFHAKDANCKGNLVRDITKTGWVELAFPDRLHLAGGSDDADPVETIAPCCLLDEGDVGADVIPGSP